MSLRTATHGVRTNFLGDDNGRDRILSVHGNTVQEMLSAYAKDNAKTLHGTSSYSLSYAHSISPIEISEIKPIRLNLDEELAFHHALRRSGRFVMRGRISAGG